ncbi:MAG: EFR1 family ferrodoxin [Defluviitaleaceae bacterium]|nr:EFR1 family ferrodoxin [Defluviitaleaceae bacterium]
MMIMLYFSGTGNSKYIAKQFCTRMKATCHSIEEDIDFEKLIGTENTIGFCYPIYMSSVPRIMREFLSKHMKALKGKKIIILCTQWLLSGDGTRKFALLLPKNHVEIIYTAHFFMPNNMNDIVFLPISKGKALEDYRIRANRKIELICNHIKNGKIKKRGFSILAIMLGFPQAFFMTSTEKWANKAVRINSHCNQCGICIKTCPMHNFHIHGGKVQQKQNCTMCYRCINTCPKKAINIFVPGKIKKQYKGI